MTDCSPLGVRAEEDGAIAKLLKRDRKFAGDSMPPDFL